MLLASVALIGVSLPPSVRLIERKLGFVHSPPPAHVVVPMEMGGGECECEIGERGKLCGN